MLTPVEMQNKALKSGRGYKKKETDEFLEEVFRDYELLYKENLELKDKLSVLSDGLQYYKDLEKTLQKTLVVAEKAAEETRTASISKANSIEQKAKAQARYIIEDAKKQAEKIHNQTVALLQQYENYRSQYKQLVNAQLELMESDAFHLHLNNIAETPDFLKESDDLEENTKATCKQVKEPSIKRVSFLNDEKKKAVVPKEEMLPKEHTSNKIIETRTEEKNIENNLLANNIEEDLQTEHKLIEKVKPKETTTEEFNKITEAIKATLEKKEPEAKKELEKLKERKYHNDVFSDISNDLQKEDDTSIKKNIVKTEPKKELKRPDRLKINRPERLSGKTDISQSNSVRNKTNVADSDDTFEFF